jgi:hypothetical protein
LPLTQISCEFKKGNEIFWHCMASTSSNPKTAKGFAKPKDSSHYKAGTLVKLFVKTAKYSSHSHPLVANCNDCFYRSIKLLSQVPTEDEYLTSFNTKFKVTATIHSCTHLHVQHQLLFIVSCHAVCAIVGISGTSACRSTLSGGVFGQQQLESRGTHSFRSRSHCS